MRTQGNPIKKNPKLAKYKKHRVIMPVYIPSQRGYYKDAFSIFKKSINSLIHTIDLKQTNITVINNASISKVDTLITQLQSEGKIDTYIKSFQNRGKADTIIGAAKASYEPFITFADADVLFEMNWLNVIDQAFFDNPSAGVICPFPAPQLKFHHTVSTWLGTSIFRIKCGKVVQEKELSFFAKSIGRSNFFKPRDINKQFYFVRNKTNRYLIGAGHFVATYRKEVFEKMRYTPTSMGLKGGLKFIELSVDQSGFMRISIVKNMVYHMGNQLESWIEAEYQRVMNAENNIEIAASIGKSNPKWTRFIPKVLFPLFSKCITYGVIFFQKYFKHT